MWYLIVSIPDLCTLTYFAIIVLQMYCYYKCFVALPHGAVVWSAVCECGIFLIILAYFLKLHVLPLLSKRRQKVIYSGAHYTWSFIKAVFTQ